MHNMQHILITTRQLNRYAWKARKTIYLFIHTTCHSEYPMSSIIRVLMNTIRWVSSLHSVSKSHLTYNTIYVLTCSANNPNPNSVLFISLDQLDDRANTKIGKYHNHIHASIHISLNTWRGSEHNGNVSNLVLNGVAPKPGRALSRIPLE